MKVTAYGFYNYSDINDQKEHLTLCPKRVIDNCSYHDYSGNTYIFETNVDIKIVERKETYYDMTCTLDYAFLGDVQVDILCKKGVAYITPDNPAIKQFAVVLGSIKKAIAK